MTAVESYESGRYGPGTLHRLTMDQFESVLPAPVAAKARTLAGKWLEQFEAGESLPREAIELYSPIPYDQRMYTLEVDCYISALPPTFVVYVGATDA